MADISFFLYSTLFFSLHCVIVKDRVFFDEIFQQMISEKVFYINKKEGETVVQLDEFKAILNAYTEPLVEVRDSL